MQGVTHQRCPLLKKHSALQRSLQSTALLRVESWASFVLPNCFLKRNHRVETCGRPWQAQKSGICWVEPVCWSKTLAQQQGCWCWQWWRTLQSLKKPTGSNETHCPSWYGEAGWIELRSRTNCFKGLSVDWRTMGNHLRRVVEQVLESDWETLVHWSVERT